MILLLLSCSTTQTVSNKIETGNYAEAFDISIAELNKDKNKNSNQKHIPLLKEAYHKATDADIEEIKQLEKLKTAESLKRIYGNYLNLDIRQDEVRALLPLSYEGKNVEFKFSDYTSKITQSKKNYADHLYSSALKDLNGSEIDARNAHKHLEDLMYMDPVYKSNLNELLQKAKNKGSSFVLTTLKNNISTISNDSLNDLNTINSSNFNNPWVIYHNKKDHNIKYDYEVMITLDKLSFEPEKTLQETIPQEAKVQDGWQYQLDGNGNVMKDEKGNDIKAPKYITVKAEVVLYQQNKSSKIDGNILIKNNKNNTTISENSEFGEAKFQHLYGKYRGDQRAIDQKYYEALKSKAIPYPKDYEFIKYSLINFKQKINSLLEKQQF
jgi:hypothetical protein